ncbi:MAG: hypothetical protein C0469_00200 [Cyanobacteria bacterium DS2.3.42]|nr:hypothetical protein [Cyanobacteria bacterium DS2.3.42]
MNTEVIERIEPGSVAASINVVVRDIEQADSLETLGAKQGVWLGEYWTATVQDGVLTATLDCRRDKVNTLKGRAIEELGAIVFEQERREANYRQRAWKGLVITSSTEKSGIAGANLLEIKELVDSGDSNAIIAATEAGKEILCRLKRLACATVAAMNGKAWLGGGLELACFCDYRIAVPGIKVGLPEIFVGIFPGLGGTQMVPRLMPRLTDAIEFVTSGKSMPGAEALTRGLIDELADDGDLLFRARQYCLKARISQRSTRAALTAKTKARRARQTFDELKGLTGRGRAKVVMETLMPSLMEHLGDTGRHWLLQSINQVIRDKTVLSSPLAAAFLVMKSRELPLKEGLALESQLFAREALSPFARGMLFLFASKEGARDAFLSVTLPSIKNIAVVGAGGPMGAGIAALYAASCEIEKLVMIDINAELLTAAHARVEKHLGKLSEDERRKALQKIVIATDYIALADADVIIEAVPEKVELKKSIYKQIAGALEKHRPWHSNYSGNSGGVGSVAYYRKPYFLFSNTSALDLDLLAADLGDQAGRFSGLHFFNPPEAMQVVEVPRAAAATDETMAVGVYLASIAGKAPIPCTNQPGFVVNRILGAYLVMTSWLLAMGVAPEDIDKAMKHAGAPMGPTMLLDLVGVDIGASVARTLSAAFGERMRLPGGDSSESNSGPNVIEILLGLKDLGQKTGRGIWVWRDGKQARDARGKPQVNPALLEAFPDLGKNKTMARETIQYLLLGAVINEALRTVEDCVVTPEHLGWIDVAFSLGTGIDAVYGGPLHHLDAWGVKTFGRLSNVIARCGDESWRRLFAPAALLTQLAHCGESFESFRMRKGK